MTVVYFYKKKLTNEKSNNYVLDIHYFPCAEFFVTYYRIGSRAITKNS